MTARRAFVLAWAASLALLTHPHTGLAADATTRPPVSIDDIAAGIEKYIAERSAENGGYFKLQHNK
jgi:hypothetical protein